ncbi:nucleotidyltransferase [Dactylosporangium sp. NPDC050588]|uniref:nucleotidyltransferase domain-containing protein n=1 Tax=Dactylosporangium sp. NPDC050588 TaxID=3157211 RepID=UPI0033ED2469
MTMTLRDRTALLRQWIKPSSDSEQQRQDRAVRMIENAIKAHAEFSGTPIRVYAKGSYANKTNVRLDSDVDIVVENHDCQHFDYHGDYERPARTGNPYEGKWTPEKWRKEVTRALQGYFGDSDVDASGEVALAISEVTGSRPSADVVPSFDYRRYDDPNRRLAHSGSKVFKKSGGEVVNWPKQQLENGREKNGGWFGTGGRYKNYVRALKNAENALTRIGAIEPLPSYLMECLVWNVPNTVLTKSDLDRGFRATLQWLNENLDSSRFDQESWEEPNQLKYLFGSHQKWTVTNARTLISATWTLLEY